MGWTPHGSWHVNTVGRLLLYRISGAFNREGAEGFGQESSRAVGPLVGQRWAVLGRLEDWDLGTIDTMLPFREVTEKAIAHGCELECLVPGQGELKHQCLQDIIPTGQPGFELILPPSYEQALTDLEARGYGEEVALLRGRGFDALLQDRADRLAR